MNFPFNVHTDYAKPSGVQVEWKCHGLHEGCLGHDWKPHSLIPKDGAKEAVATWNHTSTFFRYRLKP